MLLSLFQLVYKCQFDMLQPNSTIRHNSVRNKQVKNFFKESKGKCQFRYFRKRQVFSSRLKTIRDSAVLTFRAEVGNLIHKGTCGCRFSFFVLKIKMNRLNKWNLVRLLLSLNKNLHPHWSFVPTLISKKSIPPPWCQNRNNSR